MPTTVSSQTLTPGPQLSMGAITSAAPTLSGSSGADLTAFKGTREGVIIMRKTAATGGNTTVTGPSAAGGPQVHGYDGAGWHKMEELNGNASIALPNSITDGVAIRIAVPGWAERLAIVAEHADTDDAEAFYTAISD